MVELDITGKSLGNDGFATVAVALVTSIDYTGEYGKVVKLEELSLRDNKIDISSLPALGQVIRLAAEDIRDLDVSNNLICVNTHREAQVFEEFLRCFSECCVLRRLDFSGNQLGPKAFGILAKRYGQEEPMDPAGLESPNQNSEHDETNDGSVNDSTALRRRLKKLSVTSEPDDYCGEVDTYAIDQALNVQDKPRKGQSAAVWVVGLILTWSPMQNRGHQPSQTRILHKDKTQCFIKPAAVYALSHTLFFPKPA